jgi:hypothetical protein
MQKLRSTPNRKIDISNRTNRKPMKKCKNCKKPFQPINSLNRACSLPCAIKLSEKKEGKIALRQAQRQEVKEMAIKLKTLGDYKKELQTEINKLVRLIDQDCSCLACGAINTKVDASHFRGVQAWPALRYNLFNIYSGCAQCNTYRGGNLIKFREGILREFGDETMNFIDDLPAIYPSLKLMQHEVIEKIQLTRELEKEITNLNKKDKLPRSINYRIELRKKYNSFLAIYN